MHGCPECGTSLYPAASVAVSHVSSSTNTIFRMLMFTCACAGTSAINGIVFSIVRIRGTTTYQRRILDDMRFRLYDSIHLHAMPTVGHVCKSERTVG